MLELRHSQVVLSFSSPDCADISAWHTVSCSLDTHSAGNVFAFFQFGIASPQDPIFFIGSRVWQTIGKED